MTYSFLRSSFAACLMSFSIAVVAHSQSITGVIAESELNAPSGLGGGVGGSQSLSVSSDLLKLSGTFDLTTGTTSGGSSTGNFVELTGLFNLEPGQAFSLAYDYDVSLTGGGEVLLTTMATTDFNGVQETLTSAETITAAGDYNFTFADLGVVADSSGSGSWTGRFSFDWTNAPADSRLLIEIPNNSIDFAVASVPEPGCAGLAMAALVVFVSGRRRQS